MNVIEKNVSDAEMHEKCNEKANFTAKQYLVKGMLTKKDAIEDDQRPVNQSKYHTKCKLNRIFSHRFGIQMRQVIVGPFRCEKMVEKYKKHHVCSL